MRIAVGALYQALQDGFGHPPHPVGRPAARGFGTKTGLRQSALELDPGLQKTPVQDAVFIASGI